MGNANPMSDGTVGMPEVFLSLCAVTEAAVHASSNTVTEDGIKMTLVLAQEGKTARTRDRVEPGIDVCRG